MSELDPVDSQFRAGATRPSGRIASDFWRFLFLLSLLAAVFGGVIFWTMQKQPVGLSGMQPMANANQEQIPYVPFTDITVSAGIRFEHHSGAYGEKLLPETMGGGVAFFDFNNDNLPDLLFVNSTEWPWRPLSRAAPPGLALYQNLGDGKFLDVTLGSGLEMPLYGMGVAAGDYDNDGLVDLFITAVGENQLYRNRGGGKFENVTTPAGVSGASSDWSTSAAWADYDLDGDLDLFVCNYVQWTREIDLQLDYRLPGIGRAYGPPMNFSGTLPYLYRNEGDGRFKDVSAESGVQVRNSATGYPAAKSLGVAPVDVNDDGWIDFVVANDTVQNFVFENQQNGTFRETGARTGIAFDTYGQTRGAMGIDSARFRDDDALGIAIGNFANEMNALYVAQPGSVIFADEAIDEGLGPASRQLLKFGLFFFDYDLDGRLDVLTANGHLEEEIHEVQGSQSYRQPAQLFWNSGKQTASFVPVPPEKSGVDLFKPIVGRGSAFADMDGDGDLDVVLTQINGPPLLLRNDLSFERHWLRVKLIGTKANRDGIGSWVEVRAQGQRMSRQVMPTRGYLSQSELVVTFGLASFVRADQVIVKWPGGTVQSLRDVDADQQITIRQQ